MSSNPNPLPDDLASSARRRLLMRGGLKAAPLAMTLVSASALGQTALSSSACLLKQTSNPESQPQTNFVRVPIRRVFTGNGNGTNLANSADFISGADLQAIATAQGTNLSYTGNNGLQLTSSSYVALRVGQSSTFANSPVVVAGNVVPSTDSRFGGNVPPPSGSDTVVVRIDSSGNVIGFFYPTNTSIGGTGGTALSGSCQTSFINRAR